MLNKEPSILLYAEIIYLPKTKQSFKRKGDIYKLESINIREKFSYALKPPVRGKRGLSLSIGLIDST